MLKRFLFDESGAALIEYGLIVALVALGTLVVLGVVGTDVGAIFFSFRNIQAAIPIP